MGNRLVDVAVVVIMEAQNAQNTFDGVIERGHTVTFGVPGKIRICALCQYLLLHTYLNTPKFVKQIWNP